MSWCTIIPLIGWTEQNIDISQNIEQAHWTHMNTGWVSVIIVLCMAKLKNNKQYIVCSAYNSLF